MPRSASIEIVTPKSLSPEQRRRLTDALYAVHQQIFDGVEREAFARYVVESKAEQTWILLQKSEAGEIVGYCALHIFERQLGEVPVAVFRAEAGSLRAWRGGNITMRFALPRVLRYLLANPGRRAYYLGSLVHPSSYTLFARYFGEVWPRPEAETPPGLLALMDELASEFGLEKVEPAQPLVRHVGWRTRETEVEREYWRHCDRPAARFFIEANPGYVEGHGLVTVVPLTARNVAHLLQAVCGRRLRRPVEAARALARRLPGAARLLRPELVRQLQAAPIFAHLDARELGALAARAEILTLPAGRHVFREGDSSDEIYLLARGAAYVLVEEGEEEKVVDELGSGAVFGEIAMLARERRTASVRTATASTLIRIPRAVLLPWVEGHARLRRGMWRTFAGRRFDDLVREHARYGHLGRKGRLALLEQGEHREVAAHEGLSVAASTHLFVVTGRVEFEREGMWMATRGPMLMEVAHPLRVVAREPSQVILLSRATCA